ncbi:MAG: heme lyase CcmF/NrfE family subunit [Deltaproteobacteria bacterium]|nr:heme lyase CcmF/NrfE family subunit [Deltaproteobacteria bacterium]
MVSIGNYSQLLALFFSLTTIALLLTGIMKNDFRFIMSGRRALVTVAFFTSTASIALVYLFFTNNFQVEYVASYSNRALPLFYKATAFWAGQKGSLLFWAWILSLFSAVVVYNTRDEIDSKATPYIYTVLAATLVFFLALITFVTNPFDLLRFIPPDGKGLNPMLQNPGMIFHPPTLFLGYVGFTIPFAYAIAAMASGNLDESWLKKTRVWNILAWVFLTIGILLGGQWAYVELGWGGYWAWDPVENASFIPWLVATAFIHTAIIQERRNIMKVWNMTLILLTFVLSLFGTYLVRSGILQSVHDFGATGLGGYFLVFMGVVLIGGFSLIASSYRKLRSEKVLESYLSRESTFLFNNVILLALAFSTLFGTLFPLISEAVTGNKITVSMPFFNRVNTPLFLALLLVTGLCPLIGWRKASADNLKKNFMLPFLAMIAGTIILLVAGIREFYPLVAFSLCIFVAVTILREFWTGAKARGKLKGEPLIVAFPRLLWRMRRRYGGFIAHLGLVLMVIGITGSNAYKLENQATLTKGQTLNVGAYSLRYDRIGKWREWNREVYAATLSVFKNGTSLGTIRPEKRFYVNAQQPTTEVSLRSTLLEDLYVTMPAIGRNWDITLKVMVNPLLQWVWIGGFTMVAGGLIAIIPGRKRRVGSNDIL